ncbi:MAG: hypothetical protein RBR25_00145 [Trichloromonas sp.]|nr:hypothetical protein [Trichloromonas sp.]
MLIRVIYSDGRHDLVKPFILDRLIDQKGIRSFKRSNGWVALGVDPVRTRRGDNGYQGVERRSSAR